MQILMVLVCQLVFDPTQVRQYRSPEYLAELEMSIARFGIKLPLRGRYQYDPADGSQLMTPDGKLSLIGITDGSCRFEAGKAVGLKEFPVVIEDGESPVSDREAMQEQITI